MNYKRIIISGTLTTLSNFHIGTGELQQNDDETRFNALSLDANNNPYIPASSLRGYLRAVIKQVEEAEINALFGFARQAETETEKGNIGKVRIYDALWCNKVPYKRQIITQTSIDPLTKTAKEHQLASHAIVPPNSQFELSIELDNASDKQLALILKALNTFGKDYGGKLGKAKTSGQGQLQWKQLKLEVLTESQFIKWLKSNNDKSLSRFYQSQLDDAELNALLEAKIKPFVGAYQTLSFLLHAKSPVLINDAQLCEVVAERRKEQEEFEPDLCFSHQNNTAFIQGSTLKGWVRAHCRKILYTLIKNQEPVLDALATPDKLLEEIFGNTQQQGLIEFNTASVEFSQEEIHQQTFTAIDRFTGGVLDGALYNAEAIWPKEAFEAAIRYQEDKLKGWMKLLLLFVIRDAMQGDLVLGWGKSKGYGRLQLSHTDNPDWQTLYNKLDKEQLAKWQSELEEQINKTCQIEEESQSLETNTEKQGEVA